EAFAGRLQGFCRLPPPDVVVNLSERVADALGFGPFFDVLLHPGWRTFRDVEHRPIAQRRGELLHRLRERTIRQPRRDLVRADLAADIVQDVAVVERVKGAHAEIDTELQAGLTRRRIDAVILLEQENAESVEAGVLHTEAIFSLIHAKATGSA